MGIPINNLAGAILALAMGAGVSGAAAQSAPSVTTKFSSTTGWTSNAGNNEFEQESLFARQSGSVTGTVRGTDYVLRGSISGSQTQYLDAAFENDRSAEAQVILDYQLAPETALRGSIRLALNESGAVLDLGSIGIASQTLSGEIEAALTLVQSWDQLEVALDLGHIQERNGESRFPDLSFDPERLNPDIFLYTAGLRSAYHINDSVALLADIGWRHLDIPDADQVDFGRMPVTALRLSAGGQMGESGSQLVAKGGADVVFAAAQPGVARVLPYAEIEANWAVSEGFGVNAAASAQTYLQSPADGIADWTLALSAGARWVPMDELVVSASAFAEQDYLSDGESWVENRQGVRIGASKAFGTNFEAGINFSLSDTQYAGGGYRTAQLGLDLNAVM